MSKKTLLNETQIRRFMKLADLGATQKFKSLREGDVAYDRDEDMGMDPEMEAPAPEDEDMAPVGDEGGGMELPPEAVEAVEQAVEAAVDAMGAELERYGVSVDASREGEGDEMDAAPEAPEAPEGEMPDMGGEDDLMEDKQANKGRIFIAKNRNGPDGLVFPVFADWSNVSMKVLERMDTEEESVQPSAKEALSYIKQKYAQLNNK